MSDSSGWRLPASKLMSYPTIFCKGNDLLDQIVAQARNMNESSLLFNNFPWG
jgi:hypothetical protein